MNSERTDPILPSRIPTLDGWRAIAIGMVLYSHAGHGFFGEQGPFPNAVLVKASNLGGFGVSVFFALSGFLITARLLDERRTSGGISLKAFYVRRSFRILPAAFTYLLAIAVLGMCGLLEVAANELLAAALFFRNYIPQQPSWFTGHFWTLSVEEHFYLIWPALLILLLRTKHALGGTVALASIVLVWRTVDFHYQLTIGDVEAAWTAPRSDHCIDRLIWGAWFAILLKNPTNFARVRSLLPPRAFPVLLLLLVLSAGLKRVFPAGEVLQRVLMPALIASTAIYPLSLLGRLLETAPLRFVGRLSYSLYLWQQLFLLPPEWFVRAVGPTLAPFLGLLGLFASAWLSYEFIEQPLIKVGHRVAARFTRTSPAPSRAGVSVATAPLDVVQSEPRPGG